MKTPPSKMKVLPSEKTQKGWNNKKETIDPRPSISLTEKQLPELKSWILDKKYSVTVILEMKGIRTEDYGPNKGLISGDFKIHSIGLTPPDPDNDND